MDSPTAGAGIRVLRVWNTTRSVSLGDAIDLANTSAKRRQGLLKHSGLKPGEGLLIVPCEGVHTWFMKFPIDVAFLGKDRKVLKVRKDMGKWQIALCLRAHSVLELPAGTLEQTGTQPGDMLTVEKG